MVNIEDHSQGMADLRNRVRGATLHQLRALVLELVEQPEINTDVHLLAMIMRGVARPRPARHEFSDEEATMRGAVD